MNKKRGKSFTLFITVMLIILIGILSNTMVCFAQDEPMSVFNVSDTLVLAGESFEVNATLSSPDSISLYEWDWNYDAGPFSPSEDTGIIQTHSYSSPGDYNIALRVTDGSANSVTVKTISVVDEITTDVATSPTADPGGPYTINWGEALYLDGSGSFDRNSANGDSIVNYNWSIGYNSPSGHYSSANATVAVPWTNLCSIFNDAGISLIPMKYNPIWLKVTDTTNRSHEYPTTLYISIWPSNSSLTASNILPTTLTLTWTVPDTGVTGYKIYQDESLIATLDTSTTTYTVTGLTENTSYDFTVEAANIYDNWSVDGPSETVTTAPVLFLGSGTLGDPYQIWTAENLNNINSINSFNTYFRLENDINLNIAPYNEGEGWTSIGNTENKFKGIFDGNGHTVSGLYIYKDEVNSIGFFGIIEKATLKNLNVTNVNITGNDNVGGLVGFSFESKIDGCSTSGQVTGNDGVGGLVGYIYDSNNVASFISESYSEAIVVGNSDVGGLVGFSMGTITDAYATGTVTGYSNVGGLIGRESNNNGSKISNCYAAGAVTGTSNVGGLIGNDFMGNIPASNFWDTESSGIAISDGGVGKTTEEMKQFSTFVDEEGGSSFWDFETLWKIGNNLSYPKLQWASEWTVDEEIAAAKYALDLSDILGDNVDDYITTNLVLATTGIRGTTISWSTDKPSLINITTGAVTIPSYIEGGKWVTLTATISKAGGSDLIDVFMVFIEAASMTADDAITIEMNALSWDTIRSSNTSQDNVSMNLINPLPTSGLYDTSITWVEPTGRINSSTGEVTRTSQAQGDQTVTLSAIVNKLDGVNQTKDFILTIKAYANISSDEAINLDTAALTWSVIKGGNDFENNVTEDLVSPWPAQGENGTTITWSSEPEGWINTITGAVTRPTLAQGDHNITLSAIISMEGGSSQSRMFHLLIPVERTPEEEIAAAIAAFTWGDINGENNFQNNVTMDLVNPLPVTGLYGTTIVWEAIFNDYPEITWIDTTTGAVRIPTPLQGDIDVRLVASFYKDTVPYPESKFFNLTIKAPSLLDGSGTLEDPYLIRTVEDLDNVRNTLSISDFIRKHFRLENDIDLNIEPYNQDEGWVPITDFQGVFDGNGKVINGLFINRIDETGVGLFKSLIGGTIKNLGVTNIHVTGEIDVGGLTGASSGTIEKCYTTGFVTGAGIESREVGGLVGYNSGDIAQSYSTVTLEGTFSIGGLVGQNNGTIEDAYATGAVTGYSYVGGLVGSDPSYNSVNPAIIKDCYATGIVTGEGIIGGLVGHDQVYEAMGSFWDMNTSGMETSDGGTGKATAEMKQFSTFTDGATWDFDTVWKIGDNISYPKLQWASEWTIDEEIAAAKYALDFDDILGENVDDHITTDLVLITAGIKGTTISWNTDKPSLINTTTGEVTRPSYTEGNQFVTLIATISKTGGTSLVDELMFNLVANDQISGDSGGGNGTRTFEPSVTVDSSGNITTAPKLNQNTGVAASEIDSDTLDTAFESAEENSEGVKSLKIEISVVEGAKAYQSGLPASALSSTESDRQIEINTNIADVTLPGNMLAQETVAGAQNVSLTIAKADMSDIDEETRALIGNRPVIQLSLEVDGESYEWSNEDAPVTVSIPYTPTAEELADPEHITVWYIDGKGNVVEVPSGRYDPTTGTVTFSTTHFSNYAVVKVAKTFNDLVSVVWAKKPIEVLASKGILRGTSETEYAPKTKIIRADFLFFLVRTLGVDAKVAGNFDDIDKEAYYYKELSIAKELGITSGTGNNKFSPDARITRQDMVVLTDRALRMLKKIEVKSTASDLEKFTDKALVAAYAVEGLASAVKEGLIVGSDDKVNPLGNTTRAEAAMFLYRIYNKY